MEVQHFAFAITENIIFKQKSSSMRISLTLLFLFGSSSLLSAQINGGHVFDGHATGGSPDSSIITFGAVTSPHLAPSISATLDASSTTLWKTGSTTKPFFTGNGAIAGAIMTDTSAPYPVSANQWFILKLNGVAGGWTGWYNPIFGFTHRYQTTAGKDGGIVEYSLDTGTTWNNVRGGCYTMTFADSFYSATDTLQGGTPAFSGTSNGWVTSRFQLFQGIPVKGEGCPMRWPVWIRFRFVSDAVAESLDGWLISSIKVEKDFYGSGVQDVSRHPSLDVYPNPAPDGHFRWPQLTDASRYSLTVTDLTGHTVWKGAYSTTTDFSQLQPGTYFYRVDNGGGSVFAGKLLR